MLKGEGELLRISAAREQRQQFEQRQQQRRVLNQQQQRRVASLRNVGRSMLKPSWRPAANASSASASSASSASAAVVAKRPLMTGAQRLHGDWDALPGVRRRGAGGASAAGAGGRLNREVRALRAQLAKLGTGVDTEVLRSLQASIASKEAVLVGLLLM
jgi:hypothetical protein